jgi:uncharacterized membrane protein
MVSQVLSYYSNFQSRRAADSEVGKDRSLSYVLGFAALGMFVTIMGLALKMDLASS